MSIRGCCEDMYECKPQPKADEGDAVAPERRGP